MQQDSQQANQLVPLRGHGFMTGGMGESSCMMVVRVVGVWQHMAIEGLMVGGKGFVDWWLVG